MTTNPHQAAATAAALRAPLEQELLAVWRTVLEIDAIGTDDDFFALGGHSLLALDLRDTLRQRLQLPKLALDPLRTPTVAAMAAAILVQLGAEDRA